MIDGREVDGRGLAAAADADLDRVSAGRDVRRAAVAVTVIEPVLPAATVVLVACAWPAGLAATVQPSGPAASIVNVISAEVSLWSVRLNVKVVVDGPLSSAKSAVSVTSPAGGVSDPDRERQASVAAAARRDDR